jgi:hypothetical protein
MNVSKISMQYVIFYCIRQIQLISTCIILHVWSRITLFIEGINVWNPWFHLKKNSVALVRKRTMPSERPQLLGEVVLTFADRGCCVVSATDPPGRILGFLDRSRHLNLYIKIVITELQAKISVGLECKWIKRSTVKWKLFKYYNLTVSWCICYRQQIKAIMNKKNILSVRVWGKNV